MAYSQDIADAICARLAAGDSLNAICKDPGMPAESTVRGWVLDDVQGFAAKYARAREIGYGVHSDKIIDLADQCRIGIKRTTKANGDVEEVEGDMIERSRLQIEARKWMLSKMLPKVFGDKLELQHKGRIAVAKELSDDELANIAAGSGGGTAGSTPSA